MSKYSKTFKVIITHLILVSIFFFAIPITGKLAPNVVDKIFVTLSDILGSGSDLIITINVIAFLLILWAIYHFRFLYNKENFLKYLLYVWFTIIPNQLYTYSGLIAFFERISSNLFLDFAIFPVTASIIGTVIFSIQLIYEEIVNYLKSTENERNAQKELRKELQDLRREERQKKYEKKKALLKKKLSAIINYSPNYRIRYLIYILAVILFTASLAALYYAIKRDNFLATSILLTVIGLMVVGAIIYAVFVIVKKFICNNNKKNSSKPAEKQEKVPKNNGSSFMLEFPSKLGEFLTGLIKLTAAFGVPAFIFIVTSGQMNFSGLFQNIIEHFENTEKDVFEVIVSFGFIANFIGLVFVGIVLIFGSLMIYYILINILRWVCNGKFFIKQEYNENIPRFFITIDDITVKLMDMIADSAKSFVSFAIFIPNFFEALYPVLFDQDAESEYEFIGIVLDQNERPLECVEVYYDDNINNKTIKVATTDSYGFYVINGLKASVNYLEFSKEGYKTIQLCLIEGMNARTIMNSISSKPTPPTDPSPEDFSSSPETTPSTRSASFVV